MGFCCLKGELKLLSSLVLSFIQNFEVGEFKNKKLETMIFICKKKKLLTNELPEHEKSNLWWSCSMFQRGI